MQNNYIYNALLYFYHQRIKKANECKRKDSEIKVIRKGTQKQRYENKYKYSTIPM